MSVKCQMSNVIKVFPNFGGVHFIYKYIYLFLSISKTLPNPKIA